MTENLNNDEESRLIERLILGEEKAFCKLYVQYKPRLFKFAIALLKSQNVAEDMSGHIFQYLGKPLFLKMRYVFFIFFI